MTKNLESGLQKLRQFRVRNFLSFREWQTLDLTVAANAPDLPGRFVHPVLGTKGRFPTFVAIFGANASGKTNMLRAIAILITYEPHPGPAVSRGRGLPARGKLG